jgi:hypothetical protein
MYENGKTRPVETVAGNRRGGTKEFSYDIFQQILCVS